MSDGRAKPQSGICTQPCCTLECDVVMFQVVGISFFVVLFVGLFFARRLFSSCVIVFVWILFHSLLVFSSAT